MATRIKIIGLRGVPYRKIAIQLYAPVTFSYPISVTLPGSITWNWTHGPLTLPLTETNPGQFSIDVATSVNLPDSGASPYEVVAVMVDPDTDMTSQSDVISAFQVGLASGNVVATRQAYADIGGPYLSGGQWYMGLSKPFDSVGEVGASKCTMNLTDPTDPLIGAKVWITSDAEGHVVVSGTKVSDSNGHVWFLLIPGDTYYLWTYKDGVKSIEGQSFIAVAD